MSHSSLFTDKPGNRSRYFPLCEALSGQAVAFQRYEAEKGGDELAKEHAGKIALHAIDGNSMKDEKQAKEEACHAQTKGVAGPAKAVKDAGERGIQIEEGAEKAHHHDELAGQRTVKKERADQFSRAQKEKAAGNAEKKAVQDTFPDSTADHAMVICGIRL